MEYIPVSLTLQRLLLTVVYFIKSNRRKIEYHYSCTLPESLIYLKGREIRRLSFVMSILFLVMSILPLISILVVSSMEISFPLMIIIFSVILRIGHKMSSLKILRVSSQDSFDIQRLSSNSIYRLLAMISISDIFFLILSIMIISYRLIIFKSMNDLFGLLSVLISIYFVMRSRQEHLFLVLNTTIIIFGMYVSKHIPRIYSMSLIEKNWTNLSFWMEKFLPSFMLIVIGSASFILIIDSLSIKRNTTLKVKYRTGLDRGKTALINYMNTLTLIKIIFDFVSFDLLLAIFGLVVCKQLELRIISPMIICALAIIGGKQFLSDHAYFFHFFVNVMEKNQVNDSNKNILKYFYWKIKLLLFGKSLYIGSVMCSYFIIFNETTLKEYILITTFMIMGFVFPILDKKLVTIPLDMLSIVGGVKYSVNFESMIIIVLLLSGVIANKIVQVQSLISLDYVYILTILVLLASIFIRVILLFIDLKIMRDLKNV